MLQDQKKTKTNLRLNIDSSISNLLIIRENRSPINKSSRMLNQLYSKRISLMEPHNDDQSHINTKGVLSESPDINLNRKLPNEPQYHPPKNINNPKQSLLKSLELKKIKSFVQVNPRELFESHRGSELQKNAIAMAFFLNEKAKFFSKTLKKNSISTRQKTQPELLQSKIKDRAKEKTSLINLLQKKNQEITIQKEIQIKQHTDIPLDETRELTEAINARRINSSKSMSVFENPVVRSSFFGEKHKLPNINKITTPFVSPIHETPTKKSTEIDTLENIRTETRPRIPKTHFDQQYTDNMGFTFCNLKTQKKTISKLPKEFQVAPQKRKFFA